MLHVSLDQGAGQQVLWETGQEEHGGPECSGHFQGGFWVFCFVLLTLKEGVEWGAELCWNKEYVRLGQGFFKEE